MGEEATVRPQVGHGRVRPAAAAGQQVGTQADHADNGHHLDDGKPELGFAEELHVHQVDGVDQHEEGSGCHPGRDFRPPVVHVLAHGGQFGHAHQDVQHPAVPARQEAGKAPPVGMGEMAERSGHGLLDDHFAQLAHDHESDEATDRVAQDHRGPGGFHHACRTQEQAGTDGAPQGDQLNMAVLQAPLELA